MCFCFFLHAQQFAPFAAVVLHGCFPCLSRRQVVLCDNPEEMADYIEKSQLTKDFGGELSFDPNEWTEHRSVSLPLVRL